VQRRTRTCVSTVFRFTTKNCVISGSHINPRKDFTPSQHSTICSLHFQPSDYVADHEDTNSTRRKRKSSGTFVRRRLKPDAVPSIFACLSKTSAGTPRSTLTGTPSSRRRRKQAKPGELENGLLDGDVSSATLSQSETACTDGSIFTARCTSA